MAYDEARLEIVLFGGSDGTVLGDTWVYRFDSAQPHEVCELGFDVDGDNLTSCADPDCAAYCAACGNTMCDPLESCRTCAGDCGACAPACGDLHCDAAETQTSCPGDCLSSFP